MTGGSVQLDSAHHGVHGEDHQCQTAEHSGGHGTGVRVNVHGEFQGQNGASHAEDHKQPAPDALDHEANCGRHFPPDTEQTQEEQDQRADCAQDGDHVHKTASVGIGPRVTSSAGQTTSHQGADEGGEQEAGFQQLGRGAERLEEAAVEAYAVRVSDHCALGDCGSRLYF